MDERGEQGRGASALRGGEQRAAPRGARRDHGRGRDEQHTLPGVGDGSGGFKEVLAEVHESFSDYRITVDEQLSEGDKVVTRFSAQGTHDGPFMGIEATGKTIHLTGIDIDTVIDGKIVDHFGEASMLDVAEQLGLTGG